MTIIDAIIQGIIQGLTEFLPVSSSGHLALVQYFTGQGGDTGAFFSILLHAGTLIAVIAAFWKTIVALVINGVYMIGDICTLRFSKKHITDYQHMIIMLIVATVPLFAFVFFKDFFQNLATDNNIIVEGVCFLITSSLLFMSDKCVKGKKKQNNMNTRDAMAMGIMQGVALLPGVSRSGSTISMGILAGLDRKFAVEFSFIMGIPAVLGAIILKAVDIAKTPIDMDISIIVIGLVTSAIFGFIAIKTVSWLVGKNKFKYFAWYTLVLGIVVIIVGIVESFTGGMIRNFVIGLFAKG